jgi:hypothetical protein
MNSARLAGLVRAVQQAPEGRRNALLYWAGCRAAEAGAPQGWRGSLEQAGRDAGLDAAEIADTLDSALGRAEP